MDATYLIPRRLDPDSCVTVTTQLAATIKKYKDSSKTIPSQLEAAAQAVIDSAQELASLEQSDSKMVEIDRATDRCVVAWNDLHDAIRRMLSGEDLLHLTQEEIAQLTAINKINNISYPDGHEFIRFTFRRQWGQLQKVKKALLSLDTELKTTGLSVLSNRFIRWIDLYGARLGITEGSDEVTDKTAQAVENWHQALGGLFFELIGYSRDPQNKDAKELSALFTTPYEQQAELERQETRAKRKKRKGAASDEF